ncbi:MAG: hypothetical protein ACTSU0_12790, partial [Alphaproteobacteria bacterium]
LAASACSRSMGEFATAEPPGPPIIVSPVITATGSVMPDVAATALAPEDSGPVPHDSDERPKKLTQEELARIIAELEALARRQSQ